MSCKAEAAQIQQGFNDVIKIKEKESVIHNNKLSENCIFEIHIKRLTLGGHCIKGGEKNPQGVDTVLILCKTFKGKLKSV